MSKHYYFNLFQSKINEEDWREIAKDNDRMYDTNGVRHPLGFKARDNAQSLFSRTLRREGVNEKPVSNEFFDNAVRKARDAVDTRLRRLQKVKDRSSFGGTIKRGLAKLAGKFGLNKRYSGVPGSMVLQPPGTHVGKGLAEARKLRALFEAVLLNRLQG